MAVDKGALTAANGAWQHVSEVIDRLRGYWRLTQTDLAEAIGMNQPQVSARLACERHWNEGQLAAVAAYFKVEVGDLFGPAAAAIGKSVVAGGPANHRYPEQTSLPILIDVA